MLKKASIVIVPLALLAVLVLGAANEYRYIPQDAEPLQTAATLADLAHTDARVDRLESELVATGEALHALRADLTAAQFSASRAPRALPTFRPRRKQMPDPPASSYIRFR